MGGILPKFADDLGQLSSWSKLEPLINELQTCSCFKTMLSLDPNPTVMSEIPPKKKKFENLLSAISQTLHLKNLQPRGKVKRKRINF